MGRDPSKTFNRKARKRQFEKVTQHEARAKEESFEHIHMHNGNDLTEWDLM